MTDIRPLSEYYALRVSHPGPAGVYFSCPVKTSNLSLYLPIYIVCSTLRPTRRSLKDIQKYCHW